MWPHKTQSGSNRTNPGEARDLSSKQVSPQRKPSGKCTDCWILPNV